MIYKRLPYFYCHKWCNKTFIVQSSHLISHFHWRSPKHKDNVKVLESKRHIRHLLKHPFVVWIMYLFLIFGIVCGKRCKQNNAVRLSKRNFAFTVTSLIFSHFRKNKQGFCFHFSMCLFFFLAPSYLLPKKLTVNTGFLLDGLMTET